MRISALALPVMTGADAVAPCGPPELLALPEELLNAVFDLCDAPTLLRTMPCCTSLCRLTSSETLWEARLAELWRDKCAPERGLRRWWRDHPPPGTLLAWQKENGVGRQYTIARGDTLSGIAQRFNVSVADLKSYNGLRGDRIMVGKTLKIPAS